MPYFDPLKLRPVSRPPPRERLCNRYCCNKHTRYPAHKVSCITRLRITTRISSAILDGWRGCCCRRVSTLRGTRRHTEDTPAHVVMCLLSTPRGTSLDDLFFAAGRERELEILHPIHTLYTPDTHPTHTVSKCEAFHGPAAIGAAK